MHNPEWKRRHQVGLVITQVSRTLLAPVWLIFWPLGWLLFCLDDRMTPAFWPPITSNYLMRCCGQEFPNYRDAKAHAEGGCSLKGASLRRQT